MDKTEWFSAQEQQERARRHRQQQREEWQQQQERLAQEGGLGQQHAPYVHRQSAEVEELDWSKVAAAAQAAEATVAAAAAVQGVGALLSPLRRNSTPWRHRRSPSAPTLKEKEEEGEGRETGRHVWSSERGEADGNAWPSPTENGADDVLLRRDTVMPAPREEAQAQTQAQAQVQQLRRDLRVEAVQADLVAMARSLEQARTHRAAAEKEGRDMQEALNDVVQKNGELTWKLREARAEAAAGKRLVEMHLIKKKNSIGSSDGSLSGGLSSRESESDRGMELLSTLEAMKELWKEMRKEWEADVQQEIAAAEARAEANAEARIHIVERDLRAAQLSEVARAETEARAAMALQRRRSQELQAEAVRQALRERDVAGEELISSLRSDEAEQQGQLVIQHGVGEMKDAMLLSLKKGLVRTRQAGALKTLSRAWTTHRRRHVEQAWRRWLVYNSSSYANVITEVSVSQNRKTAAACRILSSLQSTHLRALQQQQAFSRWRWGTIACDEGSAAYGVRRAARHYDRLLAAERLQRLSLRKRSDSMLRCLLRWRAGAEGWTERARLFAQVGLLHEQLSVAKSEAWSFKRKVLREVVERSMA